MWWDLSADRPWGTFCIFSKHKNVFHPNYLTSFFEFLDVSIFRCWSLNTPNFGCSKAMLPIILHILDLENFYFIFQLGLDPHLTHLALGFFWRVNLQEENIYRAVCFTIPQKRGSDVFLNIGTALFLGHVLAVRRSWCNEVSETLQKTRRQRHFWTSIFIFNNFPVKKISGLQPVIALFWETKQACF